jgi:hypothetical protein
MEWSDKRNGGDGKDMIHEIQKRQLLRLGHTNRMEEPRWPREVLKWVPQERRNWAGRDGAGEAIWRKQWGQGTARKKTDVEGNSGDWGRRNGDSCKITGVYIYIYMYVYMYVYIYIYIYIYIYKTELIIVVCYAIYQKCNGSWWLSVAQGLTSLGNVTNSKKCLRNSKKSEGIHYAQTYIQHAAQSKLMHARRL